MRKTEPKWKAQRTCRAPLALVSFVLVLCGCAGVSPDTLRSADPNKAALIKADVSYETHHAIFGIRWRWTIAAGRYAAHKQDPLGVYYIGPDQCLSQTLVDGGLGGNASEIGKTFSSVSCGIYVPNDSTQEPKVFVVMGSWVQYPGGKTPAAPTAALDFVQTQAIAQNAIPNTSYLQAGIGGTVGGAIVGGIVAAQEGNYEVFRHQPSDSDLRRAISLE